MQDHHLWDQTEPNCVYICRNAEGCIIYVGMTVQPSVRIAVHKNSTPWWNEVASIEIEKCGTRYDARKREADLIQQYHPTHNICKSKSALIDKRAHAIYGRGRRPAKQPTPKQQKRISEVIRRREAGETLQKIADSFGVSRQRIHQIVSLAS